MLASTIAEDTVVEIETSKAEMADMMVDTDEEVIFIETPQPHVCTARTFAHMTPFHTIAHNGFALLHAMALHYCVQWLCTIARNGFALLRAMATTIALWCWLFCDWFASSSWFLSEEQKLKHLRALYMASLHDLLCALNLSQVLFSSKTEMIIC